MDGCKQGAWMCQYNRCIIRVRKQRKLTVETCSVLRPWRRRHWYSVVLVWVCYVWYLRYCHGEPCGYHKEIVHSPRIIIPGVMYRQNIDVSDSPPIPIENTAHQSEVSAVKHFAQLLRP